MLRRESGQALPLGLALVLFGVFGALVLFNTGKVTTDKTKLVNAADAAAYSGSVWQARALNYQAYTNRAMVANQVSIAQAVTLQSWASYGAITSENIATVLRPIPVANIFASALEQAMTVAEQVLGPLAQGMVIVIDPILDGLSMSQQAMFVSAFSATPEIIKTIAEESDPRFSVETGYTVLGLGGNLEGWSNFTDDFEASDQVAMNERLDLINRSRGDFTRERNWKFFHFWFPSTFATYHRIYREGNTELIMQPGNGGQIDWEWKAKDTMSFHTRVYTWRGRRRYEVPVGWGSAFANNSGTPDQTIEDDPERMLWSNRGAEDLADNGVVSPVRRTESLTALSNYGGVRAYRSLSAATLEEDEPALKLKVEISLDSDEVRGSNQIVSGGVLDAPIDAPGKLMSSISIAEIYYKRPLERKNTAPLYEHANGYNPYWDVRLSAVPISDRLLATAMRPQGSGTVAPTGSGATGGLSSYENSTESGSVNTSTGNDGDIGSLATAFGETGFSLQNYASLDPGSLDDTIAAYARAEHANFTGIIEDQLTEVLETAFENLLSNALESAGINSAIANAENQLASLEESTMNQLGDLTDTAANSPFGIALAEATQTAEELTEEFNDLRDEVLDEFPLLVDEVTAEIEAEVSVIRNEINELQDTLNGLSDSDHRQNVIQQQINGLFEEMSEISATYEDRLIRGLMDVVNDATDLFEMRYEEADYLVSEWLRDTTNEIHVPWALDDG